MTSSRRGKNKHLRAPLPRLGVDFSSQVNSWLIRRSYRAIRNGLPLDGEAVNEYCWSLLEPMIVSDYDTFMGSGSFKAKGGKLTEVQAARLVSSVVPFVLEHYDPAEFSRSQARRAAMRRRFDGAHLITAMRLTKARAAAVLGCSTATVGRLRRRARTSPLVMFRLLMEKGRELIGRAGNSGPELSPFHPHRVLGAYWDEELEVLESCLLRDVALVT